MADNPHDTEEKSRGKGGYLIGIALVLLIVYVAAPVPMVALLERVSGGTVPPIGDTVMNVVLKPSRWLYQNVPAYEQWIDWQLRLFGLE